jgi:hypothetical protein
VRGRPSPPFILPKKPQALDYADTVTAVRVGGVFVQKVQKASSTSYFDDGREHSVTLPDALVARNARHQDRQRAELRDLFAKQREINTRAVSSLDYA